MGEGQRGQSAPRASAHSRRRDPEPASRRAGFVSDHSHYQLFNLNDDPFEQNNLATAQAAELRRMMQNLIVALDRHQAVYPVDQDGQTPLKPRLP